MNEPPAKKDMVQTAYAALEEILRRLLLTKGGSNGILRIDASNGSLTNVRISTEEVFKPN